MTADTMADGSPVTPQLDARMLQDLRTWRARRDIDPARVTLTIDEVDMLLRAADERDALRRELCEMPDDVDFASRAVVVRYDSCGIADGCGGDEVCAALCPSKRGA